MNSFEVSLGGEKGILYWRRGVISCDGYDVEAEKVALALTQSKGEGIGVLLVAIDEYCDHEVNLKKLLKNYEGELTILRDTPKWGIRYSKDKMALMYLSYSDDEELRKIAAMNGTFNYKGFSRLANDASFDILWALTLRHDLPQDLMLKLSQSSHKLLLRGLATNPRLPIKLLTEFAHNPDYQVRMSVAAHSKCPKSLMERLAFDQSEDVRITLFARTDLPRSLQLKIVKAGTEEMKCELADASKDWEILRLLSHDKQASVSSKAQSNIDYYTQSALER